MQTLLAGESFVADFCRYIVSFNNRTYYVRKSIQIVLVMILFASLHFMYFLLFSYPMPFQHVVLRQMGTFPLSMFFNLKDLFCFVCLRAAKETSCLWAQSNNKTIVLIDVVVLKDMMLLHVCDIWKQSLEKAILNF